MKLGLACALLFAAAGCSGGTHAPDGGTDASACIPDSGTRCLIVDDAGVSHGCMQGGMGPGDRDDGGGMAPAGRPDGGASATDLPFAAGCFDNDQCQSHICFYYRVKGQFCTTFCSCDSDCPPPSPGCGGQGVCRMPDP